MNINLELWMRYLDTYRTATISIAFDNANKPSLMFTSGKYAEHGGVNVFLDFEDIEQILLANNILGDNGLLVQEVRKVNDASLKPFDFDKHEKNKHELIYGTLSKYVTQMLVASLGKRIFPEINHLEKHKSYFPSQEPQIA